MRAYFISAWRSGLRGYSFQAVFTLGILLISGAYLASLFSPRQPETVAMDVGLSGLHFSLTLLSLFWVQDLVGKEIERRTATLYLAYPIPRSHYVTGCFLGISLLLLIASIVLGLLLWIAVLSASLDYTQAHSGALGLPYWSTILGLWLNSVVVASFALCIATISTVPALPLALGVAFAIAANSLGAVVDFLAHGAGGQKELVAHYSSAVEMTRLVLPDLSRLDWRIWTMYDQPLPPGTISLSCLMAGCYLALMLGIAIYAFKQRDFD
jgi:ABC-type transport system involved in multi-copper enzyme maturation permease subunit